MGILYLSEEDVSSLLTMSDAIEALAKCFAEWPTTRTGNMPRNRVRMPAGAFNLLGASYPSHDVFGVKAYFAAPGRAKFHVQLYSASNGNLLAILEADCLGQTRTGAASGLATRILARDDAAVLGVIGSGQQAFAQVSAVAAVRELIEIRVFSRTEEHRTSFARRLEEKLGITTRLCASGEECVSGAAIVTTITKSPDPVCLGTWLGPGVHVNAAGANAANRRELDDEAVLKACVRVTDSADQAKSEAGEFIALAAQSKLGWNEIGELGDLACGQLLGRRSAEDITLFKSLGIGIEDIAIAEHVYRRAIAEGRGTHLRM